jgi:pimeloyl-ACP methyl ester carboxylesterase
MERARINGIELQYEVVGTGEPVVFIHGSLIADAFRPLLSEPILAGRYRLILYHRRGYRGSSRTPGPDNVTRQAADCRELLRQLSVGRAHVVGHSYGGAVALQLALDAPNAVHSLALLEPALAVGESAQGYRDALAQGEQRFREVGAAAVVDEFLQARFGATYRLGLDRVLPGAFAQAVADAATAFEQELRGLREWSWEEAQAQQTTQPVLAVLGADSEALWPRFGETNRVLLAWLPNAERFVLPGAAHGLQMQNSRGMAEALAGFFARHPLRSGAAS